jgi:hypothetical protein
MVPVSDRIPVRLTPDVHDHWLGDHLPAAEPLGLSDHEPLQCPQNRERHKVSRDENSI